MHREVKGLWHETREGTGKGLFVRFLCVGVLNTAFGYGIFVLFLFIGVHYALAALLGTVLGVLFNFKSTGRLVFGSRDNSLIFRFVAVYTLTYFLNVAGLKFFADLGVDNYTGGALLLAPTALVAFVLQRRFVFKNAPVRGRDNCS